MTSKTMDRLGAAMKVNNHLLDNAAFYAANDPDIALKRIAIDQTVSDIFQWHSLADRPLKGVRILKDQKEAALETKTFLVARGCNAHFVSNPDPVSKAVVDFPFTKVTQARDAELYLLADQVWDVANPIKASLKPPVTVADVDAIPTLSSQYRLLISTPGTAEDISASARTEALRLENTVLYGETGLLKDMDDLLGAYEVTHPVIHQQYTLARAIDDSGGGSGTDGYDVQPITIAPGATVKLFDVPLADREIYLRLVGSQDFVWLCTAPDTATACGDTGYKLEVAATTRVPYSDLGLGNGVQVNATNIGLTTLTLTAGLKNL